MKTGIKFAVALTVAAGLSLATPAIGADDIKQGGGMVVTYKDDVSTLDPAIGYDWQNWSMIKSLFNGLMDYKPGTTELTLDLAESMDISEDGLTYTFKLREGVKFHNGRALTADDIKYSIERTVNPATQSPGQGFFWQIKGYDDMARKLLTLGCAVDATNDSGQTAVMMAALFGRTEQVRMLRAAGADVSNRDFLGNTALVLARLQGNREMVELLTEE